MAEVGVLRRRVLHLNDRLSNALQMAQRVLQNAIIFRSGTVRSHRDDGNHVAVVDDDVAAVRMTRRRGYCDCVVAVASGIEVIARAAARRSIRVAVLSA